MGQLIGSFSASSAVSAVHARPVRRRERARRPGARGASRLFATLAGARHRRRRRGDRQQRRLVPRWSLWPLGGAVDRRRSSAGSCGHATPAARAPLADPRPAAAGHLPRRPRCSSCSSPWSCRRSARSTSASAAAGATSPSGLRELPVDLRRRDHLQRRRARRHLHQPPVRGRRGHRRASSARRSSSCGACGTAAGRRPVGADPGHLAHRRRHPRAAGGHGRPRAAVIWNNVFWVIFVTGLSTVVGLAIAVLADRSRGESRRQVADLHADGDQLRGRQRHLAVRLRLHAGRRGPDRRAERGLGRPRRRARRRGCSRTAVEQPVPDRHHDLDPDRLRHGACCRRPSRRVPTRAARGGPRRRGQRGPGRSGG